MSLLIDALNTDVSVQQTVTRNDIHSLVIFTGISIAVIAAVIAFIFWYRHRLRDQASFNDPST